jgi:hypothetical protein
VGSAPPWAGVTPAPSVNRKMARTPFCSQVLFLPGRGRQEFTSPPVPLGEYPEVEGCGTRRYSFPMVGFYISPDDVAKYIPIFRSLSAWWQIVIVVGLTAVGSFIVGWRIALGHYRERMNVQEARIKTQEAFIEEYREKLKGLSPAEASEQVQRLERAVTELQKQQWRKITEVQHLKFVKDLRTAPLQRQAVLEVFVVSADAEAENYCAQLERILREVGVIQTGGGFTREWPPLDKFPLAMLVMNTSTLQANAEWLQRGFESSGIPYVLTSEGVRHDAREDYLALRIGPRPE